MRQEFKIHCTSPDVRPDTLIRLFHFGQSEAELAKTLHIDVTTVQRWKSGEIAVPTIYVKHLEMINSRKLICPGSPWNGAEADGDRLIIPTGYRLSFNFVEAERLNEYRRLYHLHSLQTDLIERLMAERNFYRENCHRQARFGLMVNNIFR